MQAAARLHIVIAGTMLIWPACAGNLLAGDKIQATKLGDSLVDERALTIDGSFGRSINGKSFQQDAIASHRGYQYFAYYDADRRVAIARRKLPDAAWEIIRFGDYLFRSNDAHNTISLGICPRDGTIHLAFDHHNDPLHYRRSKAEAASRPEAATWDTRLFGPITSELEPGKPIRITYPRFLRTPAGGLQFFYRHGPSGNGDRMMVDYDASTSTWRNTRQIDSRKGHYHDAYYTDSNSRCSYPNGYTYGPDGKLHVTWVWRETGAEPNHDLLHAYSDDGGLTWRNGAGKLLDEVICLDTPDITAAAIDRGHGLLNTEGQAVDSHGQIHTVVSHCSDASLGLAGVKPGQNRWGPQEARRHHHYWRSSSNEWHHTELPGAAGGRSKLFFDDRDQAYLIFNDNPRLVNRQSRHGNLKIMSASAASKWTDWQVIHVETGPFVNEMLADFYRWQEERILSILVQESPEHAHRPTRLRVIDFRFK